MGQRASVGRQITTGTANTDENRRSLASYFTGDAADEFFRQTGIQKSAVEEYFRRLEGKQMRLEIVVTGRTGTGKSTLVNALIGMEVAKEGHDLKPTTTEVTRYSMKTKEGVEIIVWDSPGLQDGTDNEEEYLADMKKKCSNVDLVIYCIRLSSKCSELGQEQRDFSAIQKFTDTFGSGWWENAVFFLTYGNALEGMLEDEGKNVEKAFKETVNEWSGKIRDALVSARISEKVFSKIPVLPTGHYTNPNLPGYKLWLSASWLTICCHISETSRMALFRVNENRLKMQSNVTQSDFKKVGHQQPIVVDEGMKSILVLPSVTGIGVAMSGGAVGAGIGAAVGAAGVGVGAIIGAATGAAIGAGLGVLVHMWQIHEIEATSS